MVARSSLSMGTVPNFNARDRMNRTPLPTRTATPNSGIGLRSRFSSRFSEESGTFSTSIWCRPRLKTCDIFNSVMEDERVTTLVRVFSKSRRSEIDAAWVVAESMGNDLVALLAEAFPRIRKSEGRASVMRYVGRFSRESEIAFKMGVVATQDRSYAVRHYGCALLAYSLRPDALPILSCLVGHQDARTVEDARAAIDAIKSKNHNFFQDRDHSGRVHWGYGTA
jgi:hypothetical protein